MKYFFLSHLDYMNWILDKRDYMYPKMYELKNIKMFMKNLEISS